MSVATALEYAENRLGVHEIYEATKELVSFLDQQYTTQAGLESESRKLATEMERRKNAIIEEVLLKNPTESVAAHERTVRLTVNSDDDYQEMVNRHNELMSHRDAVAGVIRGTENNIKAHTARMRQLGGYFEFLSSAKDQELIERAERIGSPF